MVTTNNIIFAGIITISLTVIGAILSDVFSPLSEALKDKISEVPPAWIYSAKIFDNEKRNVSQNIWQNETIPANAVTFYFKAGQAPDNIYRFLLWNYSLPQYLPKIDYSYQFECSFDGSSFEDCNSPKPYFNLQTEATHVFKVKTKGILGNTQNDPSTFSFSSITSSIVKGIVEKYGDPIHNAIVNIDEKDDQYNFSQKTDPIGIFLFNEIGQGSHTYTIYENKTTDPLSYNEIFFIPPGMQ